MNKLTLFIKRVADQQYVTNFHRLNSSLIHRIYTCILCTIYVHKETIYRLSFVTATVETQAPFSKSGLDLASSY